MRIKYGWQVINTWLRIGKPKIPLKITDWGSYYDDRGWCYKLGTPIPPARYKGANDYVKSRRQKWIFKLLDYCHTNGFYFIPYWYVVDPINDFKYKEVQIDEYNATTITRIDDSTHPADSGYMKMGDLTYATIKMIAAGMQVTM